MRVLVACEFSGVVREAFKSRGHDAWSCDLLNTEIPGNHIKGDVIAVLNDGWDLMIAHPPCTYLSCAGNAHFNDVKYGAKAIERNEKRLLAMEFVVKLWNASIPKICIENPVGYLNNNWKKPNQIIQPYFFGDAVTKKTCLWLKNLPQLMPTKQVIPQTFGVVKTGPKKGRNIYWVDSIHGKDRSYKRSVTFQGIANAMAEQWG